MKNKFYNSRNLKDYIIFDQSFLNIWTKCYQNQPTRQTDNNTSHLSYGSQQHTWEILSLLWLTTTHRGDPLSTLCSHNNNTQERSSLYSCFLLITNINQLPPFHLPNPMISLINNWTLRSPTASICTCKYI